MHVRNIYIIHKIASSTTSFNTAFSAHFHYVRSHVINPQKDSFPSYNLFIRSRPFKLAFVSIIPTLKNHYWIFFIQNSYFFFLERKFLDCLDSKAAWGIGQTYTKLWRWFFRLKCILLFYKMNDKLMKKYLINVEPKINFSRRKRIILYPQVWFEWIYL